MQIQGETSVNKLILLFVFDKMESALSERVIVEMCTARNTWLNYMDCMELLPKLMDDGFICKVSSAEETLYTITADGRESLNNFYITIPKSIREDISAFVKNNSGKLNVYRLFKNSCARADNVGAEIYRSQQKNSAKHL